jgi:periplasmic divalent cation tolerance protein
MTQYSVVMSTIGSEEEGRRLARSLVEARLAACVSIIPNVLSVYNWKAEVQEEREWLLLIKTRSDLVSGIRNHFDGRHPYQLPEFVVLPISEGSEEYLRWMQDWLGSGRRADTPAESGA